jgi:phosphatidylglycerophosphate synthase
MEDDLQLVLHAGDGPADPGLWALAGVPLALRSAVAGVRAGATRIVVVGGNGPAQRVADVLRADRRLEGCSVEVEDEPPADGPVLHLPTDVLVVPALVKRLADAPGDVHLPGAAGVHKRTGHDTRQPTRPLWDGPAPADALSMRLGHRRDLRRAKLALLRHARARSSPVSRVLNERLSLCLNWVLVHTPVTPNQLTVLNMLVGVAGATSVGVGTLGYLALGALLLQVTSVLDCADGEMARAKLMESKYGAWIDTVGDNVIYAAYALGLTVGYARFARAHDVAWAGWALPLGLGTLALAVLLIGGMVQYVRRRGLGGSLTAVSRDFAKNVRTHAPWRRRLFHFVTVMGQRAQFTFAFAVVAALPWATGRLGFFHGLFFAMVGFVLLACVYFVVGMVRAAPLRDAR